MLLSIAVLAMPLPQLAGAGLSNMNEEETAHAHAFAKYQPGSQATWKLSSWIFGKQAECWRGAHQDALLDGPVIEVLVPPPETVS